MKFILLLMFLSNKKLFFKKIIISLKSIKNDYKDWNKTREEHTLKKASFSQLT